MIIPAYQLKELQTPDRQDPRSPENMDNLNIETRRLGTVRRRFHPAIRKAEQDFDACCDQNGGPCEGALLADCLARWNQRACIAESYRRQR